MKTSRAFSANFSSQDRRPFFKQPGQKAFFEKRQAKISPAVEIQPQSSDTPQIQMMAPCPPRLERSDPVPAGWQAYHGNPNVFHCGFRGILEDRLPTPDDPQNECFYDQGGRLVDETHEYAGCRGTPNQYDSDDSPVSHTIIDSGGIVRSGPRAFATSRRYEWNQTLSDLRHEAMKALDWRNWMNLGR